MMQFNMYHSYTVDEHTIQVISQLTKIEQDTAGRRASTEFQTFCGKVSTARS